MLMLLEQCFCPLVACENILREKDDTEAQIGLQQNFNDLKEGNEVNKWKI